MTSYQCTVFITWNGNSFVNNNSEIVPTKAAIAHSMLLFQNSAKELKCQVRTAENRTRVSWIGSNNSNSYPDASGLHMFYTHTHTQYFCFLKIPFNICNIQINHFGCWGEYLDPRVMKWREDGEDCIMKSFITCTPQANKLKEYKMGGACSTHGSLRYEKMYRKPRSEEINRKI
jgi:hypothetical protein